MSESRKYGLPEKDFNVILSLLKSNDKIREIILFGSRAKGNNANGSDVDLAIKGDGLNLDDVLDAMVRIEDLSIPNKIDLVIYDRISEQKLKDHVDRVGKVLFKRM